MACWSPGWIAGAAVVLATGAVWADWPTARHDAQRTGTADGTSDIAQPVPYWRYYLGGEASVAGVMLVDGSAVAEPLLIYLAGGRVHAAHLDGSEQWSSASWSLINLVARADLDGDGVDEVLAQSSKQVFAFDLATGALRWVEDEGDMGTIGGVRVADLDGDDRDDVLVQECWCCGVRNGKTGVAYSFAAGFAAPTRLWTLPSAACGGPRAMLVDDIDGDGAADVTLTSDSAVAILDGATGLETARSPVLGTWVSTSWCQAAEIDGVGGKELVCALGTNLAAPGAGHRVYVLRYQATPTPTLALLWQTDVGALDGTVILGPGAVSDLDGDGELEIAVSGSAADGSPLIAVLDAATGATLGTLPGEALVGTVGLDASTRLVLSRSDRFLNGWRLTRTATAVPTLTRYWQLKARRALFGRDWATAARSPLSRVISAADVSGDGVADLFTADTERLNRFESYLGDGTDVLGGDLSLGTGAQPQLVLGPIDGAGGGIGAGGFVIAGSDGVFVPVDRSLDPQSDGVRFGGYYDPAGWSKLPSAPVFARVGGVPRLLVADSRSTLVALDPAQASNLVPPELQWERPASIAPAIVGGGELVACLETDQRVVPATTSVVALDGNGAPRWSHPIGGPALADVSPADLDGDATIDLIVEYGLPEDTALRIDAIAGVDGTLLWTHAIEAGPTRLTSGAAIADWNGDGVDDVIVHHYGVHVLSGVDGSELAAGGPAVAYFLPTVGDWDSDGDLEVTLHGGASASRALEHDLTTPLWTSPDEDRPYPYGAAVTCDGDSVFVGASELYPTRLKTTVQSGARLGETATIVLAGGARYADQAAADAAGARGDQLTSIFGHADLTGAGRPTVLVGARDGWLYGVDPCTLALDFTLAFDAPVGGMAFGDTDGDGLDEIMVSVADGYLYGLRNASIAAPQEVLDTEPEVGITDEDVDVRPGTTRLSARWSPVAGARGYEVAVARDGGGYLTSPRWIAAGDRTSIDLDDLPLLDGERYRVAVRALGDRGASPDTASDGVTVYLASGDAGATTAPPSDGCGCAGGGDGGGAIALVALAMLLARSRRRVETRGADAG